MSNNPFDPGPAAAILADAWQRGAILTELPVDVRPRSLAEGYDVQDRLLGVIDEPVSGWKLGVGSTAQKRRSGVGRSIAGRVLRSQLHFPGDVVLLPNDAPVTIEFEVAYILGRDVAPNDPPPETSSVVADVCVTFELVLSRFEDRRAVGWPSFAADNAGFHALVRGESIDPSHVPDIRRSLSVALDGQEVAVAVRGDDVTDPATSLTDLLSTARERGMRLPAGSIVSTGTVSKPFDVAKANAAITARFLDTQLTFRTVVDAAAWQHARRPR